MTFDWDEGNLSHIERHGVTAELVETTKEWAMLKPPYVRNGEVRAVAVGRTRHGRLLAMVITMRGDKVRVVTARYASEQERKWWHAENEKRQAGRGGDEGGS